MKVVFFSIIWSLFFFVGSNISALKKKDYGKRDNLSLLSVGLYSNFLFTLNSDYNSGIENLVTLARENSYPVLKKKPANFGAGLGIKVRSFFTYIKGWNWLGIELAGSYNLLEPTGYGYIPQDNINLSESYDFVQRKSINGQFNILMNFYSHEALFMHFAIGGLVAVESMNLKSNVATLVSTNLFTGIGFGGQASYIVEYRFASHISFEIGFSLAFLPILSWSKNETIEFKRNTLTVNESSASLYQPLSSTGEDPQWSQTGINLIIALNYVL